MGIIKELVEYQNNIKLEIEKLKATNDADEKREIRWFECQLNKATQLQKVVDFIPTEDIVKHHITFDAHYVLIDNELSSNFIGADTTLDKVHEVGVDVVYGATYDVYVLERGENYFFQDPKKAANKFRELLEKYGIKTQ